MNIMGLGMSRLVNHPPFLCVAGALALAGCSVRSLAVRGTADALSSGGGVYASDDDPELVRDAIPFGLKMMEALLAEVPDHHGLLLALTSGFTQYGYVFVQQEADAAELEGRTASAKALRERARRLYLRARDYGLMALDLRYPGLATRLRTSRDVTSALATVRKEDVPLVYWTAASWALAISNAKGRMDLVAELPVPEAMMSRALVLDESFDGGSLHEFYVTYDMTRSEAQGGGPARAKQHLDRALALSQGKKLGPLVAYAEAVCVQAQNRAEFTRLLKQVLAADVDSDKEHRLANLIAQRRARLLLAHIDDLFA
jgi:predicted anti-sigma-YlaC factor YlaD